MQFIAQGPEEICLSLEHQNPSITSGSPFGGKKARKGKGKARGGGGAFRSRSAYSVLRASVVLRATCRAPARIWLAVIDFQNGEQQSRSGSDKKRRNRLQ